MLNASLMAELLGGAARYRALRCLYEQPSRAFGTRELATAAEIDPGNASRWLRRWAEVGLVERHMARGGPVFQAATNPSLAPLGQLLQQDSLLVQLLRERLDALGESVDAAAVFGSTARGSSDGNSDIDLLLLTALPQLKAQALFKATGRALGRPINVLAYTPAAWRQAVAAGNELARDILDHPLIQLKGRIDATASS